MGALSGAEMMAEVRRVVGISTTGVWADSFIYSLLDQAYVCDILGNFDLPNAIAKHDISIAINNYYYRFDRCLRVVNVVFGGIGMITPMSRHDYDKYMGGIVTGSDRTVGSPAHWFYSGENVGESTTESEITIYPVADASYSGYFHFIPIPATFTDDEDNLTVLPAEWDNIIIDIATARFFRKLRCYDDYKELASTSWQEAQMLGQNYIRSSAISWDLGGARAARAET